MFLFYIKIYINNKLKTTKEKKKFFFCHIFDNTKNQKRLKIFFKNYGVA